MVPVFLAMWFQVADHLHMCSQAFWLDNFVGPDIILQPCAWQFMAPKLSRSEHAEDYKKCLTRTAGHQCLKHLSTWFLTKKLSGPDVQTLAALASAAGATGVHKIAKAGKTGVARKNIARDISRATMKSIKVPEPYMVTIPLLDRHKGERIYMDHPVLLPHEMVGHLISTGQASLEHMTNLAARTDQTLDKRLRNFCQAHNLNPKETIPLGFHGDGVPYQKSSHRDASTEVFSWIVLADMDGRRYMFSDVHKDFLCNCGCRGRCTMDALMAVFVWSMQVLFGGKSPMARHDGTPLDPARAAKAGHELGFRGLLMQARGDWAWFHQVLAFPHWVADKICWRCRASMKGEMSYTNGGPKAPWRATRYKAGEFLAQQLAQGLHVSPLFECPGFSVEDVSIGVLHCMDLGVTQDIIGNIFLEAITTLDWPGRSMADKVKTLWLRMQSFYKANRTNNRLQSVTLNTFRPFPNQPPKLKAKGGETRGLVGFGVMLANELHDKNGSDHTLKVKSIVEDLAAIYKLMFTQYTPTEARKLSMQVAFWYSKLEQEAKAKNLVAWKIKPKLHMMQELLEYQSFELGNPRGYWEYHDEDFVGQVAKIAVRKGGPSTAKACATAVMASYRALVHLGGI